MSFMNCLELPQFAQLQPQPELTRSVQSQPQPELTQTAQSQPQPDPKQPEGACNNLNLTPVELTKSILLPLTIDKPRDVGRSQTLGGHTFSYNLSLRIILGCTNTCCLKYWVGTCPLSPSISYSPVVSLQIKNKNEKAFSPTSLGKAVLNLVEGLENELSKTHAML